MINSRGKTSLPEDSSYLFSNSSNATSNGYINLEYIQVENFNTSQVINMSYLFYSAGYKVTSFNLDISGWDTSQVTNMNDMFRSAGYKAITWDIGDLSGWDTSHVTNMREMFGFAGYHAPTLNIEGLSNWDTSQVTDMSWMFTSAGQNATTWDIGDLSGWDTSQVTDMNFMFAYVGTKTTTFNIKGLSNWDTSHVTNMLCMFLYAGQNATTWDIGDLSGWDTFQVINMSFMFEFAGQNVTSFNLDLSGWDTSQVISMEAMFCGTGQYSTTTTLNIKGFNLSSSNTTLAKYNEIFFAMKSNVQIIVGSYDSRDWILGLATQNDKPEWNSDNFIVDNAAPTSSSVSISNGTSQIRTLTLASTGANRMCISSTSNIASNCTYWEHYKTTKEYAFPNTTGSHTIYVFYRMGTGDISNAVSATTTVSNIIPTYEIFDNNEYDSAFTITPGATYPWTAKNNRFESTNKAIESSTSSSTISFTPNANGTLSFDYGVSSEDPDCGKLLITLTGSDSSGVIIANNIYGIQDLTYTGNVLSGVTYTLTLSYIKQDGYGYSVDMAYIDNLRIQ